MSAPAHSIRHAPMRRRVSALPLESRHANSMDCKPYSVERTQTWSGIVDLAAHGQHLGIEEQWWVNGLGLIARAGHVGGCRCGPVYDGLAGYEDTTSLTASFADSTRRARRPAGAARPGLRLPADQQPAGPSTALLGQQGLRAFRTGLRAVFLRSKKPDPLPLLKTCEALGTQPARTLMVGDSSNDAQAARAAGCPVVLVSYGYNHGQPVREVDADGFVDALTELALAVALVRFAFLLESSALPSWPRTGHRQGGSTRHAWTAPDRRSLPMRGDGPMLDAMPIAACECADEWPDLTWLEDRWVKFPDYQGQPGGVTGTVLLAESHLAIHTWPETGCVTVDVYVCNFSATIGTACADGRRVALCAGRVVRQQLMRGDIGPGARQNAAPDQGDWALEALTPHARFGWRATRREQLSTPHQQMELLHTPQFGKVLRLDGRFMTSEGEEFFYHEALVHPAAMAHPAPRRALILGGGDGGAAEELLKHPSMEQVVVAELDEAVVQAAALICGKVTGVFETSRLQLR
ncbi:hypothetical protein FQR65_LT20606 [Abscondita terminalis]|nr:hypothetical protein FQR65_LT20606 [Abscondita terminalis]